MPKYVERPLPRLRASTNATLVRVFPLSTESDALETESLELFSLGRKHKLAYREVETTGAMPSTCFWTPRSCSYTFWSLSTISSPACFYLVGKVERQHSLDDTEEFLAVRARPQCEDKKMGRVRRGQDQLASWQIGACACVHKQGVGLGTFQPTELFRHHHRHGHGVAAYTGHFDSFPEQCNYLATTTLVGHQFSSPMTPLVPRKPNEAA
ncbi:hypothetical protein NMY22_g15103 [Coprinellus aureogranulatus]|nr:hypothetical protein NMY22_g15103 [Coprinellus aureogranulatus]